MYWWDRAADILAARGSPLRRFGLVTTNSITQAFQQKTVDRHLKGKNAISLIMGIPDHPWTKATSDSAAVRIAMTVVTLGRHLGALKTVSEELGLDSDEPKISFVDTYGILNADLTLGIDLSGASALKANTGLCYRGVQLMGAGFMVSASEAIALGLGKRPGLEKHIREYRNGRDLTSRPRGALVIDLFGLTIDDVRSRYPDIYQHLKAEVKEKVVVNSEGEKEYVGRDWNNRKSYRDLWWIFGEPRKDLRPALDALKKFIVTPVTSSKRFFQFLDTDILPDDALMCLCLDDAFYLGILSSSVFLAWFDANGSTLEDRPRFIIASCYDPFPFPSPGDLLKSQIRAAAEELDAFRKERQKEHPLLTLTQMYNVLERLKANADLDDDDERIKKDGLILILKELHEKLDALVFEAYGWPSTLTDEQILEKLVALNHERAAEEKRGHVRWLRPDYQIPRFGKNLDKMADKEEGAQITADLGLVAPATRKASFPTDAVSQTAAVFAALAAASGAVTVNDIAAGFRKSKNLEKNISEVLASLTRLGHVTTKDSKTYAIRRVA